MLSFYLIEMSVPAIALAYIWREWWRYQAQDWLVAAYVFVVATFVSFLLVGVMAWMSACCLEDIKE
jgi:hypothetical protein